MSEGVTIIRRQQGDIGDMIVTERRRRRLSDTVRTSRRCDTGTRARLGRLVELHLFQQLDRTRTSRVCARRRRRRHGYKCSVFGGSMLHHFAMGVELHHLDECIGKRRAMERREGFQTEVRQRLRSRSGIRARTRDRVVRCQGR